MLFGFLRQIPKPIILIQGGGGVITSNNIKCAEFDLKFCTSTVLTKVHQPRRETLITKANCFLVAHKSTVLYCKYIFSCSCDGRSSALEEVSRWRQTWKSIRRVPLREKPVPAAEAIKTRASRSVGMNRYQTLPHREHSQATARQPPQRQGLFLFSLLLFFALLSNPDLDWQRRKLAASVGRPLHCAPNSLTWRCHPGV